METKPDSYNNPLFTDLYQLTMTYCYWKGGRHEETAVFEAFFRKCPFKGKYAVFAGIDEVVTFLKEFKFTDAHIEYLKIQMPNCEEEFFTWLQALDCSGITVKGMTDGTLAFAKEPVLSVKGPIAIVQLLETPILNFINYATLVCTNACRMKQKAGEHVQCVEFGLRRAQGPNGAMTASKYSYMGGFDGTSNVYAGMINNIPVSGTIAHSFIMSFESEEDLHDHHSVEGTDILARVKALRDELSWNDTNDSELFAFISFGCSYPDNFLALVDTYSTIESGCKNFIMVAIALAEIGKKPVGVRLDSGDLAQLSKDCKALWTETAKKYNQDFSECKVVASNDINEKTITELNAAEHQIDVFGIGTNLVTCQAQPALGMVYKLVELEGKPKIKLSEDAEKVLIPGDKKVFRCFVFGKIGFDILLHESEESLPFFPGGMSTCNFPFSGEEAICMSFQDSRPLTTTIFDKGERVDPVLTLSERRDHANVQLGEFEDGVIKTEQDDLPLYLSDKVMGTLTELLKAAKMNN